MRVASFCLLEGSEGGIVGQASRKNPLVGPRPIWVHLFRKHGPIAGVLRELTNGLNFTGDFVDGCPEIGPFSGKPMGQCRTNYGISLWRSFCIEEFEYRTNSEESI